MGVTDREVEEQLAAWDRHTLRIGDAVVKAAGPWVPAVAGLLQHLEQIGFAGSPRLSASQPVDGRLAVGYVSGESPHPGPWADDHVHEVGRLLRELHRATATFRAPADASWQDVWIRDIGGDDVIVGHGDAAPWNIVGQDGRPQALIDWEYAGPIDRLTEVAYAVWLNAQLHDDDIAQAQGLPDARGRAYQAALIADGYELVRTQRAALVERMIDVAVNAARAEAMMQQVGPESVDAVDDSGYPVLWAITWRARSAAWMVNNRATLVRAISG